MPITPAQAYKFGFLLRAADEGLTREELCERVKVARDMQKRALVPGLGYAGGAAMGLGNRALGALGHVGRAGMIAGLGIPLVGGAAAGLVAAKTLGNNKDDIEEAKQDEIEGEYYRLAQEARRNAARKRLSLATGRNVTVVGPKL